MFTSSRAARLYFFSFAKKTTFSFSFKPNGVFVNRVVIYDAKMNGSFFCLWGGDDDGRQHQI